MDLAVLIHTCDAYNFIWPYFEYYFKQNFPDLGIKVYFVNEVKDVDFEGMTQIKTGKGSWSDRLHKGLSIIPESHVMYLQEDFLIEYADYNAVIASFNFHEEYGNDITKLGANYEFSLEQIGHLETHPVYHQKSTSEYLMSHTPIAIFNKKFLLSTLDKEYNASTHEIEVTQQMQYADSKVFCVGRPEYPINNSRIIKVKHGIRQGLVVKEAVGHIEKVKNLVKNGEKIRNFYPKSL